MFLAFRFHDKILLFHSTSNAHLLVTYIREYSCAPGNTNKHMFVQYIYNTLYTYIYIYNFGGKGWKNDGGVYNLIARFTDVLSCTLPRYFIVVVDRQCTTYIYIYKIDPLVPPIPGNDPLLHHARSSFYRAAIKI